MEQNTLTIWLDKFKNWFLLKKGLIGMIGMIAVLSVPIKLLFFYQFMSVQSNFILICLITSCLIYLLFSSFKNKWIPAIIYLIFTILMFADVAYASFFNRYLSINMLGAAGFLGDVGESIKAVLKPKFFLLFIDNILIFATLFWNHFASKSNMEITDSENVILQETNKDMETQFLDNSEEERNGIETVQERVVESKDSMIHIEEGIETEQRE